VVVTSDAVETHEDVAAAESAAGVEAVQSEPPDQADRHKSRALAWIQLGCGLALAAALLGGAGMLQLGFQHPIWVVLGAEVAATLVFYAGSRLTRNGGFNDPHWSLSPPLIALYYLASAPPESDASLVRRMVVLPLVLIWSARLTYNWMRGFRGFAQEDWRYSNMRRDWGNRYWLIELGGIHFFSMLQTWAGCLALYAALVAGSRPFGALDAVALGITVFAIWIEAAADRQLHDFAAQERLSGSILRKGLWARSRHPNYFGEVLFWWGLWLFAMAADPDWWWTIVGPLAITAMFVLVSVRLMDERNTLRRPGYERHMQRTSALIPWFERSR